MRPFSTCTTTRLNRLSSPFLIALEVSAVTIANMAAPAAAPAMPPSGADLATTWAFLEEGVDHIMTKLQTGVSYSKYMSLYTVAYNYCTSSRMQTAGDTSHGVGTGRSEYITTS